MSELKLKLPLNLRMQRPLKPPNHLSSSPVNQQSVRTADAVGMAKRSDSEVCLMMHTACESPNLPPNVPQGAQFFMR